MIVSHVVGARPNFMKAAPVIQALGRTGVEQRLIHTGQHYSAGLSGVFFEELGLPEPTVNLAVGSGSHAIQTAALMIALEQELLRDPPDLLLVYGDVNSTIAAALVASKMGLPFAHVEAGLRSFDRSMPEEVNRVVTDALATTLFATSPEAVDHLVAEGVDRSQIHFVGNPMIDTLERHRHRFDPARITRQLGIDGEYGVVTLHRPSNVDDPDAARRVAVAVNALAAELPLVIPLHPRGRASLERAGLSSDSRIRIVEPLGYVDFLSLVAGARLVATDSGGVQEETTMLGIPCLTMRPNTERPVTISHGTNQLVEPEDLVTAARAALRGTAVTPLSPPLWDGRAGERIADVVLAWAKSGKGAPAGVAAC
jgi:UDP-N-acetylglucosamine 2-epimerase (non-hydrolysing)